MSKKTVSRLAAGLCGAALLCMTAALPVFADPDESASESAAEDAAKPDLSNPVSGLEYEETEDGGIRITKYKWTSAKNIEIPAEIDGKPVTEVGEECFKYCYGETVKLPDTIRVIGERAFMFCDYVEHIDVPKQCETIGTHAFDSCSRLKEITIPETVTFIGFSAFEDSAFDETLTDEFCMLGDSILYRYNGDAEEVAVPDGVKYIAEYAFERKENLKSVKLPDSVKVIYDMAFEGCDNLSKIEVGDSIDRISPNAVANTKWQMNSKEKFIILGSILLAYQGQDSDVTVPDGVRVIAKQAFNFNSSIISVHLPDSVIRVEEGAFARCAQLSAIDFGENLEVIERKAFEGSKVLSYVRFGHHLREIGTDAFLECWKLESVNLPDSVEVVEPHAFGYQFGDDAHTFLKMDNALTLYANAPAVKAYAEEAEIPCEPLPDAENTVPEETVTTEPGLMEKIGIPRGKAWIPAALLGGIMVIGGIVVAAIRGKKEK